LVALQEDAIVGTERAVKARALLPVDSDGCCCFPAAGRLWLLWWSGWYPWTPNTGDRLEERPLVYFWLENLAFIGFLESCSLERSF